MYDLGIVIPAYNASNHIKRTIDNLLVQAKDVSLKYHLYIYDDASTDNTWEILHQYKDNPMVTMHKMGKNIPTGCVRNVGIQHAHSDGCSYVAFLDSDDYYVMKVLEEMWEYLYESNYVIGIGLYDNVDYTTGDRLTTKGLDGTYGIKIESDRRPKAVSSLFSCTNAGSCNKIYDLNFITCNKITFAETYYAEDMAFLYKALTVAGEYRIFFYNKIMHRYSHYSTNPYSNDRKSVERPDDLFTALNNVWDYLYNRDWSPITRSKFHTMEHLLIAAIGHFKYAIGKLEDREEILMLKSEAFDWIATKKYVVDELNRKEMLYAGTSK